MHTAFRVTYPVILGSCLLRENLTLRWDLGQIWLMCFLVTQWTGKAQWHGILCYKAHKNWRFCGGSDFSGDLGRFQNVVWWFSRYWFSSQAVRESCSLLFLHFAVHAGDCIECLLVTVRHCYFIRYAVGRRQRRATRERSQKWSNSYW